MPDEWNAFLKDVKLLGRYHGKATIEVLFRWNHTLIGGGQEDR